MLVYFPYEEKHLPPIFRLLSFSAESHYLDHLLAQRGYRSLDRTLVWFTELHDRPTTGNPALQALSLAPWFPIYSQFSTRDIERQDLHRDLLQRIPLPLLNAALYQQGVPVACGLGVQEHEFLGIFDIATNPEHRRKG